MVARKQASRLRLKLSISKCTGTGRECCEEASVASAIETLARTGRRNVDCSVARKQASRLRLKHVMSRWPIYQVMVVARKQASRLRLKLPKDYWNPSTIRTVARKQASRLRLKLPCWPIRHF